MRNENYYLANSDLTFYYEHVIDWQRLVPFYAEAADAERPDETASTWRDVLAMAGDYVGKEISSRAAEVDRLGTPHKGEIKVSPPMARGGVRDAGASGPLDDGPVRVLHEPGGDDAALWLRCPEA
jgi:hypothetical protein